MQAHSAEKINDQINDRPDDPDLAVFLPLELGKFLVRQGCGVVLFHVFSLIFHCVFSPCAASPLPGQASGLCGGDTPAGWKDYMVCCLRCKRFLFVFLAFSRRPAPRIIFHDDCGEAPVSGPGHFSGGIKKRKMTAGMAGCCV